jgi:NTE family protein
MSLATPFFDRLVAQLLGAAFGDLDAGALALLTEHLHPLELAAGQTLMEQGEPGDAMYICISGRLRAYVKPDDGAPRMVREMGRGQVIGEMSLYTDEPRSATVVAIRDSVLLRLDKPQFDELLQRSPKVSIALTRQIVQRLKTEHNSQAFAAPVVLSLVPITNGLNLAALATALQAELAKFGRVCLLDSGSAEVELSEVEAEHDLVLLVADASPTPWTHRCCRQADEVLLLADASQASALHPSEKACLIERPPRSEAAEILVLLHPNDAAHPQGTAAWLDRRPVADHLHIRPALPRDVSRLARFISRRAVGLVLAGGGARGFAHLGVLRALQEQGIEVDYVGGTSMGSVMGALVAADAPMERLMQVTRGAFKVNPTGDFNLLPLVSLIKGQRLRGILRSAVQQLCGGDVAIEDLWKNYFCVATNYSQAREGVLTRGDLQRCVRASTAIPGALPPVVLQGDLLCDGGSFNNFPVDVMRARRGIGLVIGADLSARKARKISFDDVPSSWTLLRDRLRPRAQRLFKLPSLSAYLLNVTILYSQSRQQQAAKACDIYFNPPLERVGLLQWNRFDSTVQQGHEHAQAVLASPAVQHRIQQVLRSSRA